MGKFSGGGPLRSLKICPKKAFILGCRLFVTGTISVTEVDVGEGSVAVWVRTKIIEIDAKEVL
jgi:hypothetical protein